MSVTFLFGTVVL